MEGKLLIVLSHVERKLGEIEDRLKAVELVVGRIRKDTMPRN